MALEWGLRRTSTWLRVMESGHIMCRRRVGLSYRGTKAVRDPRVADEKAFALGGNTNALLSVTGIEHYIRDERHGSDEGERE